MNSVFVKDTKHTHIAFKNVPRLKELITEAYDAIGTLKSKLLRAQAKARTVHMRMRKLNIRFSRLRLSNQQEELVSSQELSNMRRKILRYEQVYRVDHVDQGYNANASGLRAFRRDIHSIREAINRSTRGSVNKGDWLILKLAEGISIEKTNIESKILSSCLRFVKFLSNNNAGRTTNSIFTARHLLFPMICGDLCPGDYSSAAKYLGNLI